MTTIYVNMCADLFHRGHVLFLKRCAEMGNVTVGLHDEKTIMSYKRKPVCSLLERAAVVEACRYVDRIMLATPLHLSADFLDRHEIDIVVHGDEISDADRSAYYSVAIGRGIYREIPSTPGISTTDIIARMRRNVDTSSRD